jgi:hypothetical protein
MLLRIAKSVLFLLFSFNAAVPASASSSDIRLLQMVPPESQIVASMFSPTPEKHPSSFLLITRYNKIDLNDFFALTGADTSRLIRQVVFVAAAGSDSTLSEHSLLVSGHFNRDAIFRFAETGEARMESYHGEAILVLPPLARERDSFKHLRWLAFPDSNIAIFGTPLTVQHELDRRISNSHPDAILTKRIRLLSGHDEAWCLLPAPSPSGVIARILETLDPKLGAIARGGEPMQYGIYLGRHIEIAASSYFAARESAHPENDRLSTQMTSAHYLPFGSDGDQDNNAKIIVVKIPLRRYDQWLKVFSRGDLTISETLPH